MPHKRFPWTDDLRKMVREILVARKRCFLLEGKQRDSLEATLNLFLKHNVQTMWPDGWMSMAALSKVCGNIPDVKKTAVKTKATVGLPQNLTMNPSLSITPLPVQPQQQQRQQLSSNGESVEVKLNNVLPELQITKTVSNSNNGLKPEPSYDNKVQAPKENAEQNFQVIDLTGHADMKRKQLPKSKPRYYPDEKLKNSEGDDIQKVMEGLKVLQKMSSPIKTTTTAESATTGSPVSVIAFNKSYSPKSQPSTSASTVRQNDYTKADFCSGFQDAFQKQLMGEVGFMKSSASQPPPSSFKSGNLLPKDEYVQNPDNSFSQHTQGMMRVVMWNWS